ncbi:MAG: HAD-IIIC family phosphatase [Rhodothermales bacterium]
MQSSSREIAELHVAIAATFTAEPVEKTLSFWLESLNIPHVIQFSPYNQVFQQLLDPNSLFALNKNTENRHALNIIYIRLEDWLGASSVADIIASSALVASNGTTAQPNGHEALNRSAGDIEHTTKMLRQNAEDLVNAIKVASLKGNVQHLLVFSPISEAGKSSASFVDILSKTEAYIVDQLRGAKQVETVTQAQVMAWYPLSGYDDKHTARAGHVPYTDTCYAALATAAARRFSALTRPPHKVIVLDCDNTLWDGVCGEVGPTGVKITEPFKALQAFMLAQQEAGMVLCLASKNIEADVDAVFEQNADMLLGKNDIVSTRVNWQPKSDNIKSLAAELNLGLDSFIFIDDNPIECAEVHASCPEVAVFQLPKAPADIPHFLQHIWLFDNVGVTDEDKKRAERYRQNSKREQAKNASGSLKDFLENLNLSIQISAPTKTHFPRIAQLTQRTNQFNTTTIRRQEPEMIELVQDGSLNAAIVEVSDRYGDYGLVGVLLYNYTQEALQVDSLILSCRALGRGVEQSMAKFLAEEASKQNRLRVDVAFSQSERNEPVHAFLETVATHSKSEFSQGTVYQYNTADLLALVPLEAATPSLAVNGSKNGTMNGSSKGAAKENVSGIKKTLNSQHASNGHLWQYVASGLSRPIDIKEKVLGRTVPRPALQTPLIEAQTRDEQIVAQIWQDVLGIEGIGLEDGFKELGGTSLQLVQIYGRLRAQFDVDLPFTKLFALPTIRTFIEHLSASPDKDDKGNAIQERAARQKAAMQKRKKLQLNLR